LWRKLRLEERWMAECFGQQYEAYCQRVPALVPFWKWAESVPVPSLSIATTPTRANRARPNPLNTDVPRAGLRPGGPNPALSRTDRLVSSHPVAVRAAGG